MIGKLQRLQEVDVELWVNSLGTIAVRFLTNQTLNNSVVASHGEMIKCSMEFVGFILVN